MNQFIGIPFAWNGYGYDGASCWGLVCLVMREEFGVEMDTHQGGHRRLADAREDAGRYIGAAAGWVPVLRPPWRRGDILHMWGVHRGRRTPLHVGVCLGGTKVLHTEAGTGSCVIDVSRPRDEWRPIQGYRRHA